ncbi:TIR domain-containing adapter molecule 1 [Bombina bombina]|uniref:TIR domain-containing adapter molecule 1 n=1 Tax=Bombina bombina TaxID=8345 RepID=UPI00235AF68F|nr:TIR domain-containing adapter molecule 1 [Bombina bombina]XP_053559145.1 TIR domain-containing adapter molecule 1 [Bombina bombina]XP_053559146.1 TIR domain-containing adapter molecule 1 [Bombina bombina]
MASGDDPRSLHSVLNENTRPSSRAIPITKASLPSSMTFTSNHLQISQSPTVPFLTQRGHFSQHSVSADEQARKVYSNIGDVSLPLKIPKDDTHDNDNAVFNTSVTNNPEKSKPSQKEDSDHQKSKVLHRLSTSSIPNNCNISPKTTSHSAIHNVLPSTPFKTPTSEASNVSYQTSSSPPSFGNVSSPHLKPASIPQPSLTDDCSSSFQFYSFVILHASDDFEVASRVCDLLQKHCVGVGTTFCEGFERPGQSPITCIQDAVENSAYIILLLSKCFETPWASFQSNTVLMNSITDPKKSGTVIPFLPQNDPMPFNKIPLALKTLVLLEEKSPTFPKVVQNTFKQDIIRNQEDRWKKDQQAKAMKQQIENLSDAMQSELYLHESHKKMNSIRAQLLELLHTNLHFTNPNQFQPSTPDSSGAQQIIQINHAENVQIGNNNCMNVQLSAHGGEGDDTVETEVLHESECSEKAENYLTKDVQK